MIFATDVNARYAEDWGGVAPSFALEPYDSVRLLAHAMDLADTYSDPDAIVAALETVDVAFSQGRYYFDYGSHNIELPEGTPDYYWHQWPDPIVVMMQYFGAWTKLAGRRGDLSADLSDAWHFIYRAGRFTLILSRQPRKRYNRHWTGGYIARPFYMAGDEGTKDNVSHIKRIGTHPAVWNIRAVKCVSFWIPIPTTEIDDQFALTYALLSPEQMSVEAVYAAPFHNSRSASPGDGMEKSFEEILRLLEFLGVSADGFAFRGSTEYVGGSTPAAGQCRRPRSNRQGQCQRRRRSALRRRHRRDY